MLRYFISGHWALLIPFFKLYISFIAFLTLAYFIIPLLLFSQIPIGMSAPWGQGSLAASFLSVCPAPRRVFDFSVFSVKSCWINEWGLNKRINGSAQFIGNSHLENSLGLFMCWAWQICGIAEYLSVSLACLHSYYSFSPPHAKVRLWHSWLQGWWQCTRTRLGAGEGSQEVISV